MILVWMIMDFFHAFNFFRVAPQYHFLLNPLSQSFGFGPRI